MTDEEKFFGPWKEGPNDSECFDSPKSNIVKNTFFEKKTFHPPKGSRQTELGSEMAELGSKIAKLESKMAK